MNNKLKEIENELYRKASEGTNSEDLIKYLNLNKKDVKEEKGKNFIKGLHNTINNGAINDMLNIFKRHF